MAAKQKAFWRPNKERFGLKGHNRSYASRIQWPACFTRSFLRQYKQYTRCFVKVSQHFGMPHPNHMHNAVNNRLDMRGRNRYFSAKSSANDGLNGFQDF
jgi:hypothetical protein